MEEQTESNKRPLSLDEKKSDLDVGDNKPSQGVAKKQTTLSFAPNSGLKTHFTVPGFLTSYLTEPSWLSEIANDFKSYQFRKLEESIKQQYERTDIKVYPPKELVFNAFNQTPLSKVKVVILGQDPYHAPSQAMGLSFSVPGHLAIPSSLRNIFTEIKNEIKTWKEPGRGDLTNWAQKGVLLLNTCLTVEGGEANSHADKGWDKFTDRVIEIVSKKQTPVVFLLWGNHAKSKENIIRKNGPQHLILSSAHPSGLSANKGFFGNGHFVQTVEFLKKQNIDFNWDL